MSYYIPVKSDDLAKKYARLFKHNLGLHGYVVGDYIPLARGTGEQLKCAYNALDYAAADPEWTTATGWEMWGDSDDKGINYSIHAVVKHRETGELKCVTASPHVGDTVTHFIPAVKHSLLGINPNNGVMRMMAALFLRTNGNVNVEMSDTYKAMQMDNIMRDLKTDRNRWGFYAEFLTRNYEQNIDSIAWL